MFILLFISLIYVIFYKFNNISNVDRYIIMLEVKEMKIGLSNFMG